MAGALAEATAMADGDRDGIGIGAHVEGGAEDGGGDPVGADAERTAGVALDLEIGLARQKRHAPGGFVERHLNGAVSAEPGHAAIVEPDRARLRHARGMVRHHPDRDRRLQKHQNEQGDNAHRRGSDKPAAAADRRPSAFRACGFPRAMAAFQSRFRRAEHAPHMPRLRPGAAVGLAVRQPCLEARGKSRVVRLFLQGDQPAQCFVFRPVRVVGFVNRNVST
jgi:hypothetical protein